MSEIIFSSDSKYNFLSNNYSLERPVMYSSLYFPTVTHAFEASKTRDFTARKRIAAARSVDTARQIRKLSSLVSEWERVQHTIMEDLVQQKFIKNPALRELLLSTGASEIVIHDNQDTYWCVVKQGAVWSGENHLGTMLSNIRTLLGKNCDDC